MDTDTADLILVPPSPPTGKVRPRANLDIMDLSAILQSLAASRRSGRLAVHRADGEEKHIFFGNGRIRLICAVNSATAGNDKELLSSALIGSGVLSAEQIHEALATAGTRNEHPGVYLVAAYKELGESGIAELDRWLQQECTDIISWSDVHCEFFAESADELPLPHVDLPGRGVSVDGVLMSALSRADEWEEVRRHFDPEVDVFELAPEGHQAVAMGDAAPIARLVDGRRDISEIRELARDDALDTCKALLGMLKDEHIRAKSAAQLSVMAEIAASKHDWPKAARLYRRSLELAPGRSEALLSAAEVCGHVGDGDGVRRHLSVYVSRMIAQGNHAAAVRASHQLIKLQPDDPEPKLLLYRVLRASGDARRSKSIGKQLVLAFEQRGAFDRANELLTQLRKDFPEDTEIRQLETWTRLISVELSEAAVQYEELARTYLADGNVREAAKFSMQAWAKTLGTRAARLEKEMDMLRGEVQELREENDEYIALQASLEQQLRDAKAALKSIELSFLLGRNAAHHPPRS
jgi:tetratricopeptide (TPR) repeat protein